MKHLFIYIFMAFTIFSANAADSGKSAILMVHFGTTFDDTRALTIDAINSKAKEAFPGMDVVEAYTSRIVIKRLKERGVVKDTPREALLKLAAAGYSNVIVQSTNIIDGIEAAVLREECEYMSPFFKDLRVGRPLLYSVEDGQQVADILSAAYPEAKNNAYLFVGHGTSTPANAIYSQLDYMMDAQGRPDFTVTTVEGYPTMELSIRYLKQLKAKSVTLVPLMFVAGDHARNDIAGDMRSELEVNGFKAEALVRGLGEMPEIQNLFIEHIRQAIEDKPLSPSEHKRKFLAQ